MASYAREPRAYELMAILVPDLADDDLTGAIERVAGYISAVGGTIKETLTDSPWGRRRLAYTIRFNSQDYRDGIYVIWHYDLEPSQMGDIERELKLDTKVIRYLIVHDDPKWGSPNEGNQPPAGEGDDDRDRGRDRDRGPQRPDRDRGPQRPTAAPAESVAAPTAPEATTDEAASTDQPAAEADEAVVSAEESVAGTDEAVTTTDEAAAGAGEAVAVTDEVVETSDAVVEIEAQPEAAQDSASVAEATGDEESAVVPDTTSVTVETPVETPIEEGAAETEEEK